MYNDVLTRLFLRRRRESDRRGRTLDEVVTLFTEARGNHPDPRADGPPRQECLIAPASLPLPSSPSCLVFPPFLAASAPCEALLEFASLLFSSNFLLRFLSTSVFFFFKVAFLLLPQIQSFLLSGFS